jgi:hypothetical protein
MSPISPRNRGLFTQGWRPGQTFGESVGGIFAMDSSDWSNGIRYHTFDTKSDTEFNTSKPQPQPFLPLTSTGTLAGHGRHSSTCRRNLSRRFCHLNCLTCPSERAQVKPRSGRVSHAPAWWRHHHQHVGLLPGKAVQVKPMKPVLNAPGSTLLKLEYDGPLSNCASNFNLCRYSLVMTTEVLRSMLYRGGEVGRCSLTLG